MKEARSFHRIPLFRHLRASELERMLAEAKILPYEKGQTLFRQGARADAVWVVLEGWVHLVRASSSANGERAVVLFTITSREVFCGVSAIEPGTYTSSGIAGTRSRVVRIPAAAFNETLASQPRFACDALHLCAGRIRHMAEQYGTMAEPVLQRILRMILRLRGQFGATIPITHRELAQMSWTTTESAIRTVLYLKQLGAVGGKRGQLTVLRPALLGQLLRAPAVRRV